MFKELTARLQRRVANMLVRALVVSVDFSTALPTLQVLGRDGEVKDGIEYWLPYGRVHRPLPPDPDGRGPEIVLLALGPDHRIALMAIDRRYNMEVADGETADFDDQGQVIHIKRNGLHFDGKNILLKTDGVLRLDAAKIEIHGRTYVQTDVHGKGQRETWTGGVNFDTDTYQTGATGGATEHGLDQPDIPSTHPEGPA